LPQTRCLSATKLAVGLAIGSVGIISEAIHSGIDLMAAAIAYFSVRQSARPPDECHTFGHGKYESLSGLIEAILILAAAVMIIIEAAPNLVGGFLRPDPTVASTFFGGNLFAVSFLIFFQLCIGGVLVFLLDEVVTKWGIGSGVGLFIIAGISEALVNGLINWKATVDPYPVGSFPRLIAIGLDGASYITYFSTDILAFVTTIVIFLVIVYVESTRIEIPLAHAQVREPGPVSLSSSFMRVSFR